MAVKNVTSSAAPALAPCSAGRAGGGRVRRNNGPPAIDAASASLETRSPFLLPPVPAQSHGPPAGVVEEAPSGHGPSGPTNRGHRPSVQVGVVEKTADSWRLLLRERGRHTTGMVATNEDLARCLLLLRRARFSDRGTRSRFTNWRDED
jgi:hypothetical protein